MKADQGLMEEIDRSFGDGPGHPPLEQRIGAGRRALARRRAGAVVAVVAVVAVAGVGYAALTPSAPGRAGEVATAPQSPDPTPAQVPWEDDVPVRYLDGELQVRPGVVVHEHIENPYDFEKPRMSDAFDLTFEGQRQWVIIDGRPGAYGLSSSVPSNGWASFADYVADQAGANVARGGWPATLRLTDQGTVVASPGSEVLQRTDDPRLGDSFAPPGTPTGAAVVRAAEDGVGYFVVWRVVDGELDVITTPPRDVVGATFEELLSHARGQYADGEGLR